MTKICCTCKVDKPVADFNKKSASKDGLQPTCRECNKLASKSYYKGVPGKHRETVKIRQVNLRNSNRLELHLYLLHHPCVVCGLLDPVVMEFDHRPGEIKTKAVSKLITTLPFHHERVQAEIAKCDVVCCNCHRRRTATRAGWAKMELTTILGLREVGDNFIAYESLI